MVHSGVHRAQASSSDRWHEDAGSASDLLHDFGQVISPLMDSISSPPTMRVNGSIPERFEWDHACKCPSQHLTRSKHSVSVIPLEEIRS